jgi:hypothetical protein
LLIIKENRKTFSINPYSVVEDFQIREEDYLIPSGGTLL